MKRNCVVKCMIMFNVLILLISLYFNIPTSNKSWELSNPYQVPETQILQASLLGEGIEGFFNSKDLPASGNVKVKTIQHQSRVYDVFYQLSDGRFFVIRVK